MMSVLKRRGVCILLGLLTVAAGAACKRKQETAAPLGSTSASTRAPEPVATVADPAAAIPEARKALNDKKFGLAKALADGIKGRLGPERQGEIDPLIKEIETAQAAAVRAEDQAIAKPAPRTFTLDLFDMKGKVLRTALGKTFYSNSFGSGNTTTTARKGTVLLSFDVDITTTKKEPLLPCFLLASRKKGSPTLTAQAPLLFGFRRWDNYGSYLGNHEDHGNSFEFSDTVKFVLYGEFPQEIPTTEAIYLLVERIPSSRRRIQRFEHPAVDYENKCKFAAQGTRDEYEVDFITVEWRPAGPVAVPE